MSLILPGFFTLSVLGIFLQILLPESISPFTFGYCMWNKTRQMEKKMIQKVGTGKRFVELDSGRWYLRVISTGKLVI